MTILSILTLRPHRLVILSFLSLFRVNLTSSGCKGETLQSGFGVMLTASLRRGSSVTYGWLKRWLNCSSQWTMQSLFVVRTGSLWQESYAAWGWNFAWQRILYRCRISLHFAAGCLSTNPRISLSQCMVTLQFLLKYWYSAKSPNRNLTYQ